MMNTNMMELNLNEMEQVNGGWNVRMSIICGLSGALAGTYIGADVGGAPGAVIGAVVGGGIGVLMGIE